MPTPPRPALLIGRLAAVRSGRFGLAVAVAGLSGACAFVIGRLIGMSEAGAWLSAAGTTVIFFAYLWVFLNMRVLGYFARRAERLVDRTAGLAVALLITAASLATATVTLTSAVVIVTMVVIAGYAAVSPKRQDEQTRLSPTYPRSSQDARTMLGLARSALRRSLGERERFLARMNQAHALMTLAESEETYRHLHEAYEILHDLSTSPLIVPPRMRVALAEGLVAITFNLHRLGDDLRIYEEAALRLDLELTRDSAAPDAEFRRLLNRSDLAYARSGIPGLLTIPEPARTRALHGAVAHLRRALPMAPRHRRNELHFRLATHVAVLAAWEGDHSYLSEAVEQARQALDAITYPIRERRPAVQLVLADLLTHRYVAADSGIEDLSEAELLAARVRSLSDPEIRAMAWFVLIPVLRLRRAVDPRSVDVDVHFSAAHRAVVATPSSRSRLRLAARLGRWAAEEERAADAAWAYCEALTTARRLSATGLNRRQQQAALYEVRGLAAEATHWLLASGRSHEAVTTLESSRALVLSSAVNREMLIQRLEQRDPQLARRCADMSLRLSRVDPSGAADSAGPGLLWAGVQQRRAARAAHREWQRLAGWLAQWTEFRALLDQPSYDRIASTARRQPLVYLVAADETGYALVVAPPATYPQVLRLPMLTSARVSDLAYRFRIDSRGVGDPLHARTSWRTTLTDSLRWLREAAMQPLIDWLRLTGTASLIPVGDLALLPLHAAGDWPGVDGQAAPAAVTWSYAPSAQVLVHASEVADRHPGRPVDSALLVTMPATGDSPPSHARAMERVLRRHMNVVTPLSGGEAVRAAVLTGIGSNGVCHFTCHGAADGADPLESHLQLADDRLTVRDLLGHRVRTRLTVLAACETGVSYAQLPDESISMPAALLEAGVAGVVATLWPVEELPTLLLTARFYELWLGRGLRPPSALQQAQRWLRTSTAGAVEAYLADRVGGTRWPYRLTGRARQHPIFAHPDYWAAFTYTGM